MSKQSRTTQPSSKARSLEEAIGEFLDEYGARIRGRTLELYESVLRRHLLTWVQSHGVTELDQRAVSRWVGFLRQEYRTARGEALSEASVRTYVRTANTFLKWLDIGPVRATAPNPKRKLLEVLTRAELHRLEAAAPAQRDQLLIRVLADTGARLGEALALREGDILIQGRREHVLRIGGKTGQRLAPISAELHRRLKRYVENGRPADYHGDRVFVGLHRLRDGSYRTPGRGTIEAMIRDAASRAGIRRRVYPHLLRHTWATHMLRKGVNPLLVASTLGHSSLEMIRSTYSQLTVSDAHREVMRALMADEDE